jgi:PAS domain S-box-containing protein
MSTPESDVATQPRRSSRGLEWEQAAPPLAQLERVQADGDRLVYRGRSEEGRVLVAVPAVDPPAQATLDRFAHEYALKDELEPEWAARPIELRRERGRTLLVLGDPGGVPLAQLLGRPMETARFLRLAVALVEAVGKVHARGLIHKDIRPANILADEAAKGRGDLAVHLTGFGRASRLPRERPPPDPAELAAGALAYMAPEQTGRMNRSVDARSDLYSVGVVLYEMLAGSLPCIASDPMGWVHCHVARAPTPLGEHVPDTPSAVAAVIMKCLAKTAEDRYQTAAGLACDLRRCLAEWEGAGTIEPFAPGADDIPDVLRIPEKLYGREVEVARLLEAFDHVLATGAPELVLVSGYSGVGKSSVVNELHKALVPRGLFASGKFDQYKRDIPYSTLAQAFQGLIRRLLGQSETELDRWREALRAALEPNAALVVNLVPDLKLILGEPPPVADLPPQDAEHRFRRTLRRFIGVFARPEHPLALFLDDLQWLDAATLGLLDDLTTHPDVGSLLLVGAYRDNEVGPAHPLMRSLAAIRQAGGRVSEIALSPLGREDVGRLTADALHATVEAAAPLAGLVYDKSGGNPFFTIQFLTALAEEELLAFSPGAGRWVWDLKRIRAKGYTDNVADLMVAKLARLPLQTQESLQGLAALGDRTQTTVLALVRARPAEAIHAALREAVQAGLVLMQDDTYAFMHDRVREAAYSQIPEASRAERHLRIGRSLLSGLQPAELDERIFEVVAQLNLGLNLVETTQERDRIAELNRRAGERAKASAAYAAALTYFAAGAELLREDRWTRRYDLAFALELGRAECEYLTAELEAADRRLTALWGRALKTADRAAVTRLRIALYTAMDRYDGAIDAALEFLRQVGVHWTPHPTEDEVKAEYEAMRRRLGDRPIESLIDLPLMTDRGRGPTMDVLNELIAATVFTDKNLHALVVGRMVNISLEHGNSAASCFGYVWAGAVLRADFGDFPASFSFGRLALDLVERSGLDRYKARVYVAFSALIVPWTRHFSHALPIVRRGFETARRCGDLAYASYASFTEVLLNLALGEPLDRTQQEAEQALAFVRDARFGMVADAITANLALIRRLRGLTPSFTSFDDREFSEGQFEGRLGQDSRLAWAACVYWIRKLQACVLAGEHETALDAAARAEALLWTASLYMYGAEYRFYAALACAGGCDTAPAGERDQRLAALRAHGDMLALWAKNCPENFENRAALIAAEIARLEGRKFEAMRLYEAAIRSARDNNFPHNEALANEQAGRFCLDQGLETVGLAHLRNARAGYALWGADGKVRQLDELYPQLAREPAHGAETPGPAVGQLDATTLIKAYQAVSGEIDLPRLVETLMTITLQNAGADRGLLLLPRDGAFLIEAEARAAGAGVEVEMRDAAMTHEDGPEAVINLVIRTRERALLEDGSRPGPVWEIAFGTSPPPRSAVCLPLLRQGRLAGVLYLENSQAAYAFTAKRVAVLEVLAAQAAIALENARLYGDLQAREAKIRRLVEANIIGIFLWNMDGRVTEANDAFLSLIGYDREDLRSGRISWTDITPAEWREADRRAIDQLRAGGSSQPFEKEYVRKDGGRVPVLVGPTTFSDSPEDGVAFVLDLSEQKEAQQRLKLMVDELNHRVKNTLATVQSISAQSLRRATSLEGFGLAFQARLAALSNTHNLLNQTFWAGVGLRALVEQALAPYADGADGRIVIEGEDVRLGPIAAVTLGMALHELASNAAKYGALSAPTGKVRVSWWPSAPDRLKLDWVERGGPPVKPPSRRGFGVQLIERVLAAELHGEVRLEFPPSGVRCAMDMALGRVTGH